MRKTLFAFAAALSLGVGTANATPVTISNIMGEWTNASPTGLATITPVGAGIPGLDSIRWGAEPGVEPSGYDILPGGGGTFETGTAFQLGTFTHFNRTINPDLAITGVDYLLQFNVNNVTVNATLHFVHNETSNNAGPDGDGDVDDTVTVSIDEPPTFTLDGVLYTVGVDGFLQGGVFSKTFTSPEEGLVATGTLGATDVGGNSGAFFATIQAAQPVPEPATLLLLGSGLAGAAARRFRRRQS